jgi:hypothetical protein
MEQTIRVNGPFRVREPHDVDIDSDWSTRLWPIVNEGNIGVGAAIAWAPDKYNAQWVANALNMLLAIDEAAILRKERISQAPDPSDIHIDGQAD